MNGDPNYKKIFNDALAKYSKGDFLEAQKEFMRIPQTARVAPLAYYYVGLTFVQAGDMKTAVEWYKKVQKIDAESLELDPERFVYALYINMASAMQAIGEYEDAAKIYEEALKINENDHRVKINLGNSYLSLKRYDRAIAIFEDLTRTNPEVKEIYYCLGLSYLNTQKFLEAKEMFEIAWSKNKSSRLILLRPYQTLIALGKQDEAHVLIPDLIEKYGGEQQFQEQLEKKQKECEF